VVGVAFDEQRETLDRLRDLLVVVVPVAGLFAALVGWAVAGAALRPVDRMRREADAISGSEAGRRLEVPTTNDELSQLGDSLNRMLDRLEATVARERRFVDDASHELRTPLANLRTELELALRRSREPDELLAAVRSAADESERLSALAEDLLVLARLHDGRLPVRPEPTQVGALMAQVADSFAGRAAAQAVALDTNVDGEGTALVDPTRIRQALGNLVDNALRHTPTGGWVRMQLRRSPGSLSLAVVDSGEGFPEALLADAFDPFRRGDPARSRDHGGAGLGLAIVRAVAEAHGGRVAASNNPGGGATVELVLPA
jgi:heavy metal sensor kinase